MWIGCWWLGYLVIASGMAIAIIPMWFFPKHMKKTPRKAKKQNNGGKKSGKVLWKAFVDNVKSETMAAC